MKAKSIIKLVLTLLVIGALVFLTMFGIKIGNWQLKPAKDGVKLGLDIAGGSYIEYQATENKETAAEDSAAEEGDNKTNVSDEDVQSTIAILRARATNQGYTEANVMYSGNGRFRVELPNVGDPNDASRILGTVARLTFEDAQDDSGSVILDGKDIKNATSKFGQTSENAASGHYVALELTDDGQQKFSEATERLIGSPIYIKLDGEVYSAPMVQSKIDADPIITIGSSENAADAAKELAGLIRSGQLPFGLKEVGASSVSATLGQNAYTSSLWAGLISIILIVIYMIIFYRVPGIVAGIALIFYTVLMVLAMGLFGINLNLPGIAGIVLSLGMAVDANVVIFERIIDELKNGKTLHASVDAGFHRALTAVIDGNITTLISAGVLLWLGSGTVKGFATTLFIGIVISMFTAIFVTKFLLKQLIQLNIKNRKLYGIGVK